MVELSDSYDPTAVEPHWRDWWLEQGFFRADEHSDKPYLIDGKMVAFPEAAVIFAG